MRVSRPQLQRTWGASARAAVWIGAMAINAFLSPSLLMDAHGPWLCAGPLPAAAQLIEPNDILMIAIGSGLVVDALADLGRL